MTKAFKYTFAVCHDKKKHDRGHIIKLKLRVKLIRTAQRFRRRYLAKNAKSVRMRFGREVNETEMDKKDNGVTSSIVDVTAYIKEAKRAQQIQNNQIIHHVPSDIRITEETSLLLRRGPYRYKPLTSRSLKFGDPGFPTRLIIL